MRPMLFLLAVTLTARMATAAQPILLLDHAVHLRSGTNAEWQTFADLKPAGRDLRLVFQAESNAQPATLVVAQDDVKLDWPAELNGRKLGLLFLMEAPLQQTFVVAPGLLKKGENELIIRPPRDNDDIRVGPITLYPRAWPSDQTRLHMKVTEGNNGKRIPARFTVVDTNGLLPAMASPTNQPVACRPGVLYTATGEAEVWLRPGTYNVYATRGFEYGLAQKAVTVASNQLAEVELVLDREVATPGWVSCDTHIHTFTYSRHGDASVDERVITLAGEGIELPIATDHNILTDFRPHASVMGVASFMTPVIGDEVTTLKAHYNIFPVTPGSAVPDAQLEDWSALLGAMRTTPGVRVVILNHPHNIHHNFEPFAPTNFAKLLAAPNEELGYDAIELVNSSALQTDLWQVFHDWFALLNQGHHLVGVGSSDVHDVSRYIVGQGRTYIRCADEDPARIDIEQACRALREGHAVVSFGLFLELKVDGRYGPGDSAPVKQEPLEVEMIVQAPSWIEADHLELYRNGQRVRETQLKPTGKGGEKARVKWTLPSEPRDGYLVAIASGPPVRDPYWAIAKPYQPRGPIWNPRVIACTNPVWFK